MLNTNAYDSAVGFVKFVLYHRYNLYKIMVLPENEIKTLLDILHATGFKADRVKVREDIPGNHHGRIISDCHFLVFGTNKCIDRSASGWLHGVLSRTAFGLFHGKESREDVADELTKIIRTSVPFEPIPLPPPRGKKGALDRDFLAEKNPSCLDPILMSHVLRHTTDDDIFSMDIGVHISNNSCGGKMERRGDNDNKETDVIYCCSCHNLWPFSKHVHSYGDLRRVFDPSFATR